jgi:hypothetical protein
MHVRAEKLTFEMQAGELEIRGDVWGDQHIRHIHAPAGTDMTPLLKGLPGDLCSCPHYGVMLEGSMTLRYADGTEETTEAGEYYYWPAGHTGWTTGGAVFYEISPAAEIAPVLQHIAAQLAAT